MTRRLIFPVAALLALVWVACGDRSRVAGEHPRFALVPGPATGGLRLSARLDARHGLVRYEVAIVGERPVTYAEGHLGAVLEARRAGAEAWIPLALRPDALRIYSGMGPIESDLRTLEPGATMPRDAYFGYVDQRRFTAREGTARPGLEVPRADEPFVVDLLDYLWPPALGDLDHGAIELRVAQVHPDWSELLTEPPWSGRVPSAILRLQLALVPPVVRAQMDRSDP